MDAFVIYEILRDSSIESVGKRVSIKPLSDNFTERDVLKAMDGYFQELVREYRERRGKERDEGVEQTASAILLSLMGYEVEGGAKADSMDEVEEVLRFLISHEEIRTAIAESNEGVVESLYQKKKELRKMGE